jgi:hypothetical protein
MNTNKRSLLTVLAFSVTVAAGLTGLSLSGQTRESSLDQACAHATWPTIPVQCLDGADADRSVRMVATRASVDEHEPPAERFALVFN